MPTQSSTIRDAGTNSPSYRNTDVGNDFTESPNTTITEAGFFNSLEDLSVTYWVIFVAGSVGCLILGCLVGWIFRGTRTRSRLQEKIERIFQTK